MWPGRHQRSRPHRGQPPPPQVGKYFIFLQENMKHESLILHRILHTFRICSFTDFLEIEWYFHYKFRNSFNHFFNFQFSNFEFIFCLLSMTGEIQ